MALDPKTQELLVGLAKDWLTGGISAGVSKTAVAPIGEFVIPTHSSLRYGFNGFS